MIGRPFAFGALAFLAACGQQNRPYPPRYEFEFMQECERTALQSVCACAWQRVVAEVPLRDFEEFSRTRDAAERERMPLYTQLRGYGAQCAAAQPPPIPAPIPTENVAPEGAPVEPTP